MRKNFILTVMLAIIWTVVSIIIDWGWFMNLTAAMGYPLGIAALLGVALLPGLCICFFSLAGLLFNYNKEKEIIYKDLEDISILIAAHNEEKAIYETIQSIAAQDYPKKIKVKIINNNSIDNTEKEILRAIRDFPTLDVQYIFEPEKGKHFALNTGLKNVDTKYFITLDADTILHKNAIIRLVNSIIQEGKNDNIAAVAGAIFVRNSKKSFLSRIQEWEYFLSISTIKRSQSLFKSTLIMPGAFSIYNTDLIRTIGGYQDCMAEDICLSWQLLSLKDYKTMFCSDAIVFTNVPEKIKDLFIQRKRWSRGGLESIKCFNFKTCKNNYVKFYMFAEAVNFIGEAGITFFMIPGIIMAVLFHNYLLISWWTAIMFLITFLIYIIMFLKQRKYICKPNDIRIKFRPVSFILYTLFYPLLLAPICICGYLEAIFKTRKKW